MASTSATLRAAAFFQARSVLCNEPRMGKVSRSLAAINAMLPPLEWPIMGMGAEVTEFRTASESRR